jgi:RNA-directed DNA polymerase
MSLTGRGAPWPFQPPVAQRDVKAEVAHCVGGVVSPLLANLFMHYAFDAWMARACPAVTFERYCDDVVVHCRSKARAEFIRDKIAARLAECGLELHPVKTRLVYCKDSGRSGSSEHEQFTFLWYTFRPRLAKSRAGHFFVSFSPAVSREALTRIRRTIRGWRIHRRSDMTFAEIVDHINTYVAGWGRGSGKSLMGDFRPGDTPVMGG